MARSLAVHSGVRGLIVTFYQGKPAFAMEFAIQTVVVCWFSERLALLGLRVPSN